MISIGGAKPECLVYNLTGARVYGSFRGLMGWNVNKFLAHIGHLREHMIELLQGHLTWGTFSMTIQGGTGGVTTTEVTICPFLDP